MIPNDILLTEISLPAYSGMDETAKAAALNAKTIVTYHTVEKSLVLDYLIKQDLWPKIEGILLQPAGSSVDQAWTPTARHCAWWPKKPRPTTPAPTYP